MVCLVWLIIYAADFRTAMLPQRFLTLFVFVCMLLYFCHSWYFLNGDWHYGWIDVVYLFCNLSVYPLFYFYVVILTKDKFSCRGVLLMLAAALAVALTSFFTHGNKIVLSLARVIFALEVVFVAVFGLHHLSLFRKEVRNFYADTEGKTLRSTFFMLVFFVLISIASFVANILGRDEFQASLLLGLPSVVFSAFLFSLFYVGTKIGFYAKDFKRDIYTEEDQDMPAVQELEDAALEAKICAAIENQKLFLVQGLKISDVAAAVGSNRTYVSNAINNAGGMSFTDYVNSRRIEYAKKRLLESYSDRETAISEIAAEAGFASFPSFYRAFVKFTGKSPSVWLNCAKR